MGRLIIVGDDHVKAEEPFYSAKKEYFEWFINQDFNNEENYMVHLGDFFHRKTPSPKEYELAFEYFNNLKFKKIYILAGNGLHEYNRAKNCYAIDPFSQIDNIDLIHNPKEIKIESLNCLFLPSIPDGMKGNMTMKEFYNGYFLSLEKKNYDYIFGHFFHKNGFGEEISLEELDGNIRMGHYHIPTKDLEYVGVNTITRKDEKGIDPHLNSVDLSSKVETLLPIPRFIDYYTIIYPEEIELTSHYGLLSVYNAPDQETIIKKYASDKVYIHEWFREEKPLLEKNDESIRDRVDSGITMEEYLKLYFQNTKVSTNIQDTVTSLIVGGSR